MNEQLIELMALGFAHMHLTERNVKDKSTLQRINAVETRMTEVVDKMTDELLNSK